jgi:hypothetical protein
MWIFGHQLNISAHAELEFYFSSEIFHEVCICTLETILMEIKT